MLLSMLKSPIRSLNLWANDQPGNRSRPKVRRGKADAAEIIQWSDVESYAGLRGDSPACYSAKVQLFLGFCHELFQGIFGEVDRPAFFDGKLFFALTLVARSGH